MRGATATEIKNKFGQILEEAMSEPVIIEKNGRQVAVMMSMAEYKHLIELEDRYWGEMALKSVQEGFMTEKETRRWLERKLDAQTARK